MPYAEELIAGVVSSVLAVLLVEIYLWLRRRYRNRALRWLVGMDTAAVVTPVYPWAENSHPAGLLTTYDAIGLAHVLEACNRVGTVPVVTRSGESAENSPLDVIAIGGPSGNQVTATFLKAYCPGFEILTDPDTGYLSYRCGDRTFTRTEDETFAFIVRLSPRETGLPGTALIAWGHSAVSTASAGYYLARYASSLRKVGKGSFFVAISVRWVLGYRSFDTRPIDLTRAAFSEPVPSRAPAVASVTAEPLPASDPVSDRAPEEPERRRRFGRSGRSAEPPPPPASASSGRSTVFGRSRVAEALDDVRAADPGAVATGVAVVPSRTSGTTGTGVSQSVAPPSDADPAGASPVGPSAPGSSETGSSASGSSGPGSPASSGETASSRPSPRAASSGGSSTKGAPSRRTKGAAPSGGTAAPGDGPSDPSGPSK